MSKNDDLVRRLRGLAVDLDHLDGWNYAAADVREAADAIERGAARGVTERAAMLVEGWSTAQNHLPDGVDGGWLADRDLEMSKAIRALATPPAPAPDAGGVTGDLLSLAKDVESYFQGIDRGNGILNPARTAARNIINRYGSKQEKRQWGGQR